MAQPYVLASDEGALMMQGIPHLIKAGERGLGRGLAAFVLDTVHGEEPPMHTHRTEDEVFYVLEGEITFTCAGKDFFAEKGAFVFLPQGLPHTYAIPEGVRTKLLVLTFPAQMNPGGWGGYLGEIEGNKNFAVATPAAE